jgi:hypothetical protein
MVADDVIAGLIYCAQTDKSQEMHCVNSYKPTNSIRCLGKEEIFAAVIVAASSDNVPPD